MLNKPLSLQLQKCLPDRAAAEAQILGERAVREPLAGPHVAAQQEPANLGVGV